MFGAKLLLESLTAVGAGWSAARTAGLAAALVVAGALSAASWFHRARGGALAPVIGEDTGLSTSRAVAAAWVLFVAYAVLVLAGQLAVASGHDRRDALISGLELGRGTGAVTVLAVVCGIAVLVRRVVGLRVLGQRLQKVRADRPRASDLLTDDAGRGTFADIQYVVISTVALVFAGGTPGPASGTTARPALGTGGGGAGLGGDLRGREVRRGRAAGDPLGGPVTGGR
ncbi:hypothetical protein SVIOM342S_02599 [Streptomyces violaceorubidus]